MRTRVDVAIWKSAALSSSPPIVPSAIKPSIRSRCAGELGDVAPRRLLAAALVAQIELRERPAVAHCVTPGRRHPHRSWPSLVRSSESDDDGPPEDAPRDRLLGLLAPKLGDLDRVARVAVFGEERRLGLRFLERSRAICARAVDALSVELQTQARCRP